ncbi:MAG: hypothetical protein WD359_05580 [Dehalococcoidia bacterium]
MSGIALTASRIVCWWAATYTLGLASSVRDARRTEIASDTWEQHHDESDAGQGRRRIASSMLGRMLRGVPADLLWRVNVEGPKVDINIPFQRIAGGLLLALIVMLLVTTSISGYDTGREGFEGELTRLADLSAMADNGNAFFRAFTAFGLIGAAAGLYVALHQRSQILTTIAAFGLLSAGVLALVAGALQIVFVDLAEQYVSSTGSEQESVLVTARAVGLTVDRVTGASFMSMVLSTYVLAILLGRESLVPRWLIGIPVMSAGIVAGSLIAEASGVFDDGMWFVLISGMLLSVVWLLIAGLYLLFSSQDSQATSASTAVQGATP